MGVMSLGRHIRPACTQGFTRSLKLCQECGFNSCVRVFFIPMGHVVFHGQFDVILVTWAKCAILIGRDQICFALIGYRLQGPL